MKILGSWSGMRKYLERDMLAESLIGRIRYGCTTYVGMDDFKIFEICIDGVQVKRFSLETVNTYFIENGYKKNSNNTWSVVSGYEDIEETVIDRGPLTELFGDVLLT